MYHEKVFVRESGLKVKVCVTLRIEMSRVNWIVDVATCQPRKRTWMNVHDTNDYRWRMLKMEERKEYEKAKHLEFCSREEIQSVASEILDALKKSVPQIYASST